MKKYKVSKLVNEDNYKNSSYNDNNLQKKPSWFWKILLIIILVYTWQEWSNDVSRWGIEFTICLVILNLFGIHLPIKKILDFLKNLLNKD